MARQSHPTILLTRPAAQSQRFAAEIGGAMISPLMQPEYLQPALPRQDFVAVVLTSEAGAEAAKRISARGTALPKRAFCVGMRTAAAARAVGFEASSADGDANDLLAHIQHAAPIGPLLFLRGQDSAGDVQNRLISAGIETFSAVVYRQIPLALSADAEALLRDSAPVILPVFSSRSAAILADELRRVAAKAPVWLAALSPAVAEAFAFPTNRVEIAARRDSSAMRTAIDALCGRMTS